MSDQEFAIQVQNVSKCYRIYAKPEDRLFQGIYDLSASILKKSSSKKLYREHWALKNVSFELKQGEVMGILGRNGAGKSTLLQAIAGTIDSTEGSVKTSGRITALLELGSGFNPEFTGRENVLLNAQILGMSRDDALTRFDEIASFADIGDFIDQPVKTYSSGMMMRLAFAVQTSMTPQVLIVDEALAVGDMLFQAKCLRRLREMREAGTTILFVSHSINTVKEICTRAILLDRGNIVADGFANDVSYKYFQLIANKQSIGASENSHCLGDQKATTKTHINYLKNEFTGNNNDVFKGVEEFEKHASVNRVRNGKADFLNVSLRNSNGNIVNSFDYGEKACCKMVIKINSELSNLWVGYKIQTISGIDIIHADSSLCDMLSYPYRKGEIYILDWQFNMRLMHGSYLMSCAIGLPNPPTGIHRVMEYVDMISIAQTFAVAARREGMIGGTAVWDNELKISKQGNQTSIP